MNQRPPKPTPLASQIAASLDSLSGLAIGNCVLIPQGERRMNEIQKMFGISEEALMQAANNRHEKESRQNASSFRCCLPDWTGQGGMIEFWMNDDGTYESMDSRIGDKEIRDGMQKLAHG